MMSDNSANNNRIAKNTLFLYVRMILVLLVSLYTSRVVLAQLGESDYGIYNIVGGVLVLFSFLNAAMISTTQRFINFEMGKGVEGNVGKVFSMAINCHLLILLLLFFIAETLGLWFLNTYLNIPEERLNTANWVYQFVIISTCINIFYSPYNAAIISYERMSVFAYVSIVEILLKLSVAFALTVSPFDKLFFYGFLQLLVVIIVCIIYIIYCRKSFPSCHYHFDKNKNLFKEMMNFSGWSLMGQASNLAASQGINIVMNLFFGVVVNAAMGVANQVFNAVNQLVSNFSMAFKPQIVKSFSSGDSGYFNSLIYRTSKLCYFLLFVFGLPIIIFADEILNIWLEEVPEYATVFVQLYIVYALIDAICTPIWSGIQATGIIKANNIVALILRTLVLPISIGIFYFGGSPKWGIVSNVFANLLIQIYNTIHLSRYSKFILKNFFKESILPCVWVTLLATPIPLVLHKYLHGLLYTFMSIGISILFTLLFVGLIGLKKSERSGLIQMVRQRFF